LGISARDRSSVKIAVACLDKWTTRLLRPSDNIEVMEHLEGSGRTNSKNCSVTTGAGAARAKCRAIKIPIFPLY